MGVIKDKFLLTQRELIRKTSVNTGIDEEATKEIILETINIMKEALSEGKSISLTGFGKFTVRKRRPKHAYNMNERKKIIIPERNIIFFIPKESYWKKSRFMNFQHLSWVKHR